MKRKSSKNILMAFLLNIFFSVAELTGGIFTNSISIISDSIHDFGDAVSLAIAWGLEKKSEKKPDKKYTYGYARYSVLGALITSMILLAGAVVVLYNAIPRLLNPQEVNYDGMLIFAIIGLIMNGIGAIITSKGERLNEKVVSLHLLEDVLGWAATLIVSIVMKIWNIPILDPILSIAITAFILFNVFKNLKEIFSVFLEKAPNNFDFETLRKDLTEECRDIVDIHHAHVWTVGGSDIYITLHVVIPDSLTSEEIIGLKKKIKEEAEHHSISHVTVEIEFESERCENDGCVVKINDDGHHHHHHH